MTDKQFKPKNSHDGELLELDRQNGPAVNDILPQEADDPELDTLVRDLTKIPPMAKSEVRARLLAWEQRAVTAARIDELETLLRIALRWGRYRNYIKVSKVEYLLAELQGREKPE